MCLCAFSISGPNLESISSMDLMDDDHIRDLIDQHIKRLVSREAMAEIPKWSEKFLAIFINSH